MIGPGSRLTHYDVIAAIGKGGMGEVWRARDTRLGRDVAIKTLPTAFVDDADRLARFEREARLLASLNHPNIAAIHGFEEDAGTHFLVLELVEGQTLEERLRRGRLSTNEALGLALQVAEALEAAHEHGVIHRDLKPANIKTTPEGRVKVLDFGLAKALTGDGADVDVSDSPTISLAATQQGVILGTAAYMSPEQAGGGAVDKRTDIWSFGAVLFEMLAGAPLFHGETVSHLLAAVLRDEPDWTRLPAALHPQVRFLLKRCLERNLRDRSHDISDARIAIRAALDDPEGAVPTALLAPARASRSRAQTLTTAALVLALAALGGAYVLRRAPAAPVMRFTASLPESVRYSVGEDFLRSASISPDGRTIVFTGVDAATGDALLYRRPIDAVEATPIPGSEDGGSIFWSPDGRSVGFFAGGKLKTVNLSDNRVSELADANNLGGATWNEDGVIVASLVNPGPLHMIPPDGSPPVPVTPFDPSRDVDHDAPVFLEDGRHFLYLSWGRTLAESQIWAASLDSPDEPVLVVEGVTAFAYAPGYLVFIRGGVGGALMAQRFDTDRLQLTGEPTVLAESAAAPVSTSANGAVVYRSVSARPYPLIWIDRNGTELGRPLPPGYYRDAVISPDGTRVAFARGESENSGLDIAVLDLASGQTTRLTTDPADDRAPVWSPDGERLAFLSFRPGAPGIYVKNANGVGAEQRLFASPGVVWPYQWTKAGLMYFAGTSGSNDVWMMSADDPENRTPLIESPFNDVDGAVSPDGGWFAYTSNESGRWEIYLTSFPPSSTKLPVTSHGGADPTWSPDGTELFYVRPSTAELMSVPVVMGNPPRFGESRRVHGGPLFYPDNHTFDIAPDGRRLIVTPSSNPLGEIAVLVNWPSLVSR